MLSQVGRTRGILDLNESIASLILSALLIWCRQTEPDSCVVVDRCNCAEYIQSLSDLQNSEQRRGIWKGRPHRDSEQRHGTWGRQYLGC